ncbi:DUF1835 domain-containing protein [Aquimarina hainanensis]|uniref:DUF1835 domain-containing protein n=1 Tax=Aquimarina hainanensis TaxID=1578017 RepID=A0ABW5NAP9_9FLAO|nr:DUF1835 domain-containing protein [Aquimarina sp. TRL1]QKX06879.1 DUF1835 domain-containing protein [Aquimarina sp. TRL1]
MKEKTLHITNGDSLTERLEKLQLIDGDILVWREMLCEGPTQIKLETEESLQLRKQFLNKYYRIPTNGYDSKFIQELQKLEQINTYDTIVLWFEYDLFCHINMIAAISTILRLKKKEIPIYLVCSGRIEGQKKLMGLCEISEAQLKAHYANKVLLSIDDLEFASHIWTLYCEPNPKRITGYIKTESSFEYLSICLRAHLHRFPSIDTGLNILENNILELIHTHQIKNLKQLMGYCLEYQGYYGYGDMQLKRIIAKLFQFLNQTPNRLQLSDRGILAIEKNKNFYNTMTTQWYYGGVLKYQYLYNNETNRLLKL